MSISGEMQTYQPAPLASNNTSELNSMYNEEPECSRQSPNPSQSLSMTDHKIDTSIQQPASYGDLPLAAQKGHFSRAQADLSTIP